MLGASKEVRTALAPEEKGWHVSPGFVRAFAVQERHGHLFESFAHCSFMQHLPTNARQSATPELGAPLPRPQKAERASQRQVLAVETEAKSKSKLGFREGWWAELALSVRLQRKT